MLGFLLPGVPNMFDSSVAESMYIAPIKVLSSLTISVVKETKQWMLKN